MKDKAINEKTKYTRSDIRKIRAAEKRKSIFVKIAGGLTVLGITLAGCATGIFETKEANVANLFPSNSTEFATVSPALLDAKTGEFTKKIVNHITSDETDPAEKIEAPANWKYLDSLLRETQQASELQKQHSEWLGFEYAKAKWGNNTQYGYAYSITNKSKAKDFMNSEECKTAEFFAPYCGEGKNILRNGWMLLAPEDVIGDYPEKKDESLGSNEKFKNEISVRTGSSVAAVWLPLATASESLPKEFTDFSSGNGYFSASINNASNGFKIKANVFDADNKYILASNESQPVDATLLETMPANTVTGFAASNTSRYVPLMKNDPESFVNTHADWKALSDALAKWGIATEEDAASTLGTSTAFSINEGSKGNKVSGTLTVKDANKDKIISILTEAAKENSSIQTSYKVMDNGDGTITIASHDPITDGDLKDEVDFKALLGDTKNSILLSYINMDKNRELLDSSFDVNASNSLGEIGINVYQPQGNKTEILVNWIFPQQ